MFGMFVKTMQHLSLRKSEEVYSISVLLWFMSFIPVSVTVNTHN
jgi:hypothetical protein